MLDWDLGKDCGVDHCSNIFSACFTCPLNNYNYFKKVGIEKKELEKAFDIEFHILYFVLNFYTKFLDVFISNVLMSSSVYPQ